MITKNSKGWEVQFYDPKLGWLPLTEPFDTEREAEFAMAGFNDELVQLRVYEALK